MKNLTSTYSTDWALNIISSPMFRAVLLVIWIISFVRLLLGIISLGRFLIATISLLLIACIPQLFYFFQRLILVMFHP